MAVRSGFSSGILAGCADPQRAAAALEVLRAPEAAPAPRKLSAEQARILAALLSGSQRALELLAAHPGWLGPLLAPGALAHPRREEGMRHELESSIGEADEAAAFSSLRQFKQREMLRIAARDLARLSHAAEITREISDVADICLDSVCRLCDKRLRARLGQPWHLDADGKWRQTEFCVIGLGKLGGQELNYSSDVDVMFVYDEEGAVFKAPPRRNETEGGRLASHLYFTRLAEEMIAEISKLAPEGALYRIDLRLRPEGKLGPLARSLASFENFYAQWGQTWERMMLIKARPVAGSARLGAEFLEMTQSFRYPRYLNPRTLREVAAVKTRIESEIVKEGELERNVKLGRGGIREIEFVAQALQILHAGKLPFLEGATTLPVLQRLARYSLLTTGEAGDLQAAYVFLRDVEHRLQMEAGRQTHTIPDDRRACQRLARLMGFDTLAKFETARRRHSRRVREIYDHILPSEEAPASSLPPDMEAAADEWKKLLASRGFRETERAMKMLRLFLNGPDYAHVSPRTQELAWELWPRFLALCPHGAAKPDRTLSDPDRVLVRLDSFVDAYGARAMLYEMWTQNPSLFEVLLLLFDRSEFLAEQAIRAPGLVDELESSGRLNRAKSAEETLADLRHGAGDADQRLWLRRYHQAELMRIGLRDILGLSDAAQNVFEMSCLADACLQYALEALMRAHKLKRAPFGVIGLGKLGGREISYGSDLDIMFVTDARAGELPRLQPLAAELMEMLSARTEDGVVFRVDARLRPDGEKGLLVNTLEACEKYYRRRAGLWEIQALTRVRPAAGDMEVGARFQAMAAALTNFSAAPDVAAFTPGWLGEIIRMRERIEKERTPAGKDSLAIKTGAGGLMDAEFLAQALCLGRGWQEANTGHALRRAAEAGVWPAGEADALLTNYGQLRRIEGILRRWSFEGETLLPADEPAQHRVAVRCGFAGAGDLLRAAAKMRAALRAAWPRVS
ncbi:MAG TPA: bifunctional [glutamate--ammonia ligase]-adenylyl-L-tyrosine phosphorylase/[glutamate--ammonia-ligase] adenylyltransferase [Verrucomicrobiae bacterium]